ncbi:Adiponectin receptor protein 2 [Acipenser ruthenus]|uniref:Adiponectin receptor protein 2 n=1 Tax=Acipenser ruthenus TaxID=7906 RepID=A0A662YZ20_ACIRT|nr:Adiponectin receptor protein 2 [Acipenser ruthenus]
MESEEPWQETEEVEEEEEKAPDEGFMGMAPLLQAHHAMEKVEEFVHKVWEGRWRVIPHDVLPDWLKDNEYLQHGHRPPMPSFRACFKSIFRIHTETGNIWTHLLGDTGLQVPECPGEPGAMWSPLFYPIRKNCLLTHIICWGVEWLL